MCSSLVHLRVNAQARTEPIRNQMDKRRQKADYWDQERRNPALEHLAI